MTDVDAIEMLDPERGSAFVKAAGLHLTHVAADRVEGYIDLGPEHHQPYGIVHGGVYASAVETSASVGATVAALARGQIAVGVHNSTDFIRSTTTGRVARDRHAHPAGPHPAALGGGHHRHRGPPRGPRLPAPGERRPPHLTDRGGNLAARSGAAVPRDTRSDWCYGPRPASATGRCAPATLAGTAGVSRRVIARMVEAHTTTPDGDAWDRLSRHATDPSVPGTASMDGA